MPSRAQTFRIAAIVFGLIGPAVGLGFAFANSLSPSENYSRSVSVLRHLGVDFADPAQLDRPWVAGLAGRQSLESARRLLSTLDPSATFARYARLTDDGLTVCLDADSREQQDFSIRWAPAGATLLPVEPASLHQRLLRARLNPASSQLRGLRIALDPGHMGSAEWDLRTGKFVRDSQGHVISEGVIALQTALLLEQRLRGLGAEVMLTRRVLAPVTPIAYENLVLRPYAVREVEENSRQSWFIGLLGAGPPASAPLFAAFDKSPEIRSLLADSDANRYRYYVLGEELEARATVIDRFDPDLTLILHYDTQDPAGEIYGVNPHGFDGAKVFVAGAFENGELGSRESRALLARHLLSPVGWNASLGMSRAILGRLTRGLAIPRDASHGPSAILLEPGILARNLVIPRRLGGRAVSYVESLYYNDPAEFAAFRNYTHTMRIDGRDYPYSDRLEKVSSCLLDGVVDFVSQYSGETSI